MKLIVTSFLMAALFLNAPAQQTTTMDIVNTAVKLVEQQLDAYNKVDIDAFLMPYAEQVEIYTFPDKLQYTGKAEMRKRYGAMFEKFPDLHCDLVNRIVEGNTIIDHENVSLGPDKEPFRAIAVYKIKEDKIAAVYFIQ